MQPRLIAILMLVLALVATPHLAAAQGTAPAAAPRKGDRPGQSRAPVEGHEAPAWWAECSTKPISISPARAASSQRMRLDPGMASPRPAAGRAVRPASGRGRRYRRSLPAGGDAILVFMSAFGDRMCPMTLAHRSATAAADEKHAWSGRTIKLSIDGIQTRDGGYKKKRPPALTP